MNRDTPPKPQTKKPNSREERLKAALRANMARRKAQARARAETGADTETGETASAATETATATGADPTGTEQKDDC